MSTNNNPYWELTIGMFRTGILGYGGGPSVIPLIRHEAVIRYRWLNDDEFGEVLALANALPGPIATKMAAYLGYRERGTLGAVLAVLAHILPTCIAMVALLSAVTFLSSSKVVAGMIAGVTPVIAVMLGTMAYEFGEKAVKGLGKYAGGGFFVLSFLLLETVQIHPAIVIMLFLAYGTVHFKTVSKLKKQRRDKEDSA
ncbi:chromate efflux transporter subunit ChrB [Paenibacillus sp. JCM 10914]|uniref:chromate transporter n=1 Tax=Paenibacillus sp. JCM 10914 TaxID=1236974 RepID=UPI0003CC5110|nr:chromate transporter [Paenibacillus sp. JCM 10914]GAE09255.1 chromate transport protein [Paenibacillus sp. JCM 10914]